MLKPVLAAAAVLALTACMDERVYQTPNVGFAPGISRGPNSQGFDRGSLIGDIGPIRNFNDRQAQVSGEIAPEYNSSNVTVTGVSPNGSGFMILDIYEMNLRTAPAGTYRSNGYDMGNVNVIACSDSNDGSIHYDGPAEDATVTITDVSETERDVVIQASLGNDGYANFRGNTQASASFRLTR